MIFDITATQNTLKRCFFFETMCEGCLFAPIILKSKIGTADTLLNLPHNADYVVKKIDRMAGDCDKRCFALGVIS